jgi:hypothetical protein
MKVGKKSDALGDSSVTELMAAFQLMKPEPKTEAATEPLKITGKTGVTLIRSLHSETKFELGPLTTQRPSIVDHLISEASESHDKLGNKPMISDRARSPVMTFEPLFNPYAGKPMFDF